jgi:hypothetical protein
MIKTRKKLAFQIVAAIASALMIAQPVLAVPKLDYSAIDNNWYDERGNNICKGGGAASGAIVKSEDNEKTIFFSLLANGFTKLEAAAVLGNLQQESTFNPKAQEPGGKGRGIVQWSVDGRWAQLLKWKGSKDEWAIETQIQYIIEEITHVKQFVDAFAHFKSVPSTNEGLAQKVQIWADEYEIAGVIGPRLTNAQNVMNKDWYKSAPESGGGGAAAGSTGGGSCSSAAGGGSQYVDGFVVYSQTDPRWNNHPYGTTRIGPSGCGPTAMAMIITNLTGKSVLPPEAADYAYQSGMFVAKCDCSSWGIGPTLAKHYGLSSKPVGTDLAKINEALRAGALIIMSGSGPVPFTDGGHFIVIRAVTTDGKWMVGDSAHKDANTQKFDPQLILSHGNAGSAYAISK